MKMYKTKADYEAENPKAVSAIEIDFGCWWTCAQHFQHTFRISFVVAIERFYVKNMARGEVYDMVEMTSFTPQAAREFMGDNWPKKMSTTPIENIFPDLDGAIPRDLEPDQPTVEEPKIPPHVINLVEDVSNAYHASQRIGGDMGLHMAVEALEIAVLGEKKE